MGAAKQGIVMIGVVRKISADDMRRVYTKLKRSKLGCMGKTALLLLRTKTAGRFKAQDTSQIKMNPLQPSSSAHRVLTADLIKS